MAKPRSEREEIRREMNRYSSMGRWGDWMSYLVAERPIGAAKVYKLMAEDSARFRKTNPGFVDESAGSLLAEAVRLWPEVVNWTGRKDDPMVKHPELYR